MGKIESTLKSEITRLSKRATRELISKHAEEIKKLRQRVIALERELDATKKAMARDHTKRKVRQAAAESTVGEGRSSARLSPRLIQSLRKRLNLTQGELARLVGVSTVAVSTWESGRSRPRDESKARIIALRSLGRRDVQRLLAEQPEASKGTA